MRTILTALAMLATPMLASAAEHFAMSEAAFARTAEAVASSWPNLREANRNRNPRYIDSHLRAQGTAHGELAGFGVTMVAHVGREPLVSYHTILNHDDAPLNGRPSRPNLLFFQRNGTRTGNWQIIGMGYSLKFRPNEQPWITIGGRRHNFEVHEAGYHRLVDGGFRCAETDNLKRAYRRRGVTVDRAGREDITRDMLRSRINTIRHGRIWTIHVWFHPTTGAPRVASTDPWNRQSDRAVQVPGCAFFDQR